ncbi:MAG: DUF362 domain-containing protein [Candidatus Cloacimonetes bacterium]|jgi:uncharacterized protein (DUF362 family)/NAD-dependent dihydropyrimidine dehydrogenase PreA subunit|nr:DUF362 domain-containing protein [Candidatus Cloacimonadota bacterium]MDY0298965.1 DUF362 domain-containing protein [Candidatus Cloacimonadaceae bacterium]MCB5278626.1 DUF362 domain-containing protein [Candidatus Cloacimonadota bacterium]MDD2210330.1 DUF362 domain-containing protein [Candidatus Cloacimonadota bacterium]MDD3282385.1 DUF362 domain-containing protein [Candidatus Cloacimonadota bacterium]
MKQSGVQIRAIDKYELPLLEDAVNTWFSALRDNKLRRSKRVLIKPNLLGAYAPEQAVTTHPTVLEAIIRYFLAHKKEVWVGDSPGGGVSVQKVWQVCGLQDLADRYPIKLVNLSTEKYREMNYEGIPVKISETLFKCGIVINVAKYKTHSLMAFTGALKNLYGLVPGLIKSEYHRMHPDTKSFAALLIAIYGLCRAKITYNILDGIVGMDGAGPSAGTVRHFGLLMGSESISALDTVASRMMGFTVNDVPYLWAALHMDGILPSQIHVPHSFLHYRIPNADIRVVKMRKEGLKYVPRGVRYLFRKAYYHYPVISARCVRCGVCVRSCPVKAITWQENGFPAINKDVCIKCMCCHELCPTQAIDIHKSFLAARFVR